MRSADMNGPTQTRAPSEVHVLSGHLELAAPLRAVRHPSRPNGSARSRVGPYAVAVEHFELAVIGSGSGNVVIPGETGEGKVALVEGGAFGGTCINRGCIPTK